MAVILKSSYESKMLDIHLIETALTQNSTAKGSRNTTIVEEGLFNNTERRCYNPPYLGQPNLPVYVQVLITVFCSIVIIPAVFGNILVLYTFCKKPRLRRYNNYYLVSLAISDLVGGFIIMPMYAVYWVMEYWPFGDTVCEVYKFVNHIFTNATFLSVLVIAIDRYRALHYPIRHLQEQTAKHAMKMISATYIIPLIIWSPVKLVHIFSDVIEYTCYTKHCLPFYSNKISLVITVSLFSFLPMIVTTVIYIEVYKIARRARTQKYCSKSKNKVKTSYKGRLYRRPSRSFPEQHVDEAESSFTTNQTRKLSSSACPVPSKVRLFKRSFSTGVNIAECTFTNPTFEGDTDCPSSSSLETNDTSGRKLRRFLSADNLFKRPPKLTSQDRQLSFTAIKSENSRATKTLTLTYFAMILSGLPWTLTSIISQFCGRCIPYYFTQASVFTIHVSSTIDPLCYAAANPQFKDAFLEVLGCKRDKKINGGKPLSENTGTSRSCQEPVAS